MQMPRNAEHGVVGPTSSSWTGPPGRPVRRVAAAGVLVVLTAVALTALGQPSGTQALFTSTAPTQTSTIHGGVWAPDPPAACGPVSSYQGIVWGTTGDDVLVGGNHPQIIMGLAGNDTITGGNSGDCLVGGPGDDRLVGGNGKDVLVGGPGDDYLSGGNAKDSLDGSEDLDVCEGGNGKDTIVNCEYDDPADAAAAPPVAPLVGSSTQDAPPKVAAPKKNHPSDAGDPSTGGTGPPRAPGASSTPDPDPASGTGGDESGVPPPPGTPAEQPPAGGQAADPTAADAG